MKWSQDLGEIWQVAKDAADKGRENGWQETIPASGADSLRVPATFDFEHEMFDASYNSLYPDYDGIVWYYKTFTPDVTPAAGGRIMLHFNRTDFLAETWLNGVRLGEHRHSEEPYDYDVTDVLRDSGNLLAVRTYAPLCKRPPVDGICLDDIPNAGRRWGYYVDFHYGGIVDMVKLISVPPVWITDVFVLPDWQTGDVSVEATLQNSGDETNIRISADFFEKKNGVQVGTAELLSAVPDGTAVLQLKCRIDDFHLWDIDNPFLYHVQVSLDNGFAKTVRFGFRDFRVQNGFFFLNGRRIFAKSAHAPMSPYLPLVMKTAGFNMIRYLSKIPRREVIDFCDEIGLLVYLESRIAWGMIDTPQGPDFVRAYLDNMILSCRNHPSVVIWGIFNEHTIVRDQGKFNTIDVFMAGVKHLPAMRRLDPGRLILLDSGRFDDHVEIGSLCNPGNSEWESQWGFEGEDPSLFYPVDRSKHVHGTMYGLGDIHPYPAIPYTDTIIGAYRGFGHEQRGKPVFLSETGIGTQTDTPRIISFLKSRGLHPDGYYGLQRYAAQGALAEFWEKYDLRDAFAFPEDFIDESIRLGARQRQQMFDMIRANPMVCGYSLTSVCLENEGILSQPTVCKKGAFDSLQDGWAPLRWALFFHRTAYAGKALPLEIVLCNEDVLPPGTHPACVRITNAGGLVWEKTFDAVLPSSFYGGLPPMAATVFNGEIPALEPGEYRISVRLMDGFVPSGGILPLTVIRPARSGGEARSVAGWGLSGKTIAALEAANINAADFRESDAPTLILAGKPDVDASSWQKLEASARNGATIVFLSAEPFLGDEGRSRLRGLVGGESECMTAMPGLYHVDTVHIRDGLFRGIQETAGLCEYEYYRDLYPRHMFRRMPKPSRTVAAALGLDMDTKAPFVLESLTFGEYALGAGKIVINGFRIEGALGDTPAAEQMLINLVEIYGKMS